MAANRIDKVNSLLLRELSSIIQREVFFPSGIMVTVTRIEATANLIEAKVYVSVFPESNFEKALAILNKEIFGIQQQINRKLNMRPIPKIKFVKDEVISKAGRVEEILAQLKKEEK